MKLQHVFWWNYVASLTIAHAATVINFDDLSPNSDWGWIEGGYEGFQWDYLGVFDVSGFATNHPLRMGMVSSNNVASNMEGEPAWFGCGTLFDLNSAYLTAGNPDNFQMRVQGLAGTNIIYDASYNIGSRTLIQFNYAGVDRVNFLPPSGSSFVLDDLAVTRTNYLAPAVDFQKVDVSDIIH